MADWHRSIQAKDESRSSLVASSPSTISSTHSTIDGPEPFAVSPTYFKGVIMEREVSLAVFLLIVNGLPLCQKSEVIRGFLSGYYVDEEMPKHGLSFYEFASAEYVKSGQFYKPGLRSARTSAEDCYLRAMNAGMNQVQAGTKTYEGDEGGLPEHLKFKNDELNSCFHETFLALKSKNKKSSSTWGNQGFVLFNLWDIGHSRTVYHFLPALHGHLCHSYSWLFFDLHRDSQNLYKRFQSKENLMNYRPRIHYLIRSAKLNLAAEKKACSMFAISHVDPKVDDKVLQSVKRDFESTAAQIGVSDIIDFDVKPLQPGHNCKQVIQEKMDALISQELRSKFNVPFSFIFLRSIYYQNDKIVHVKKTAIQELAKELNIVGDKFFEFCKFFSSCGSIIDVSLIDPKSEYIIMKPSKFLEEIDKLFHTDDQMLADKGILTLVTAERLFNGQSHADAYTKILVSLSLAIELEEDQIKMVSHRGTGNNKVWYLPDIRCTPPCLDTTELRTNALRLLRSYNSSLGHLQTSFVTHFLKINKKSKVCVEDETPTNVTRIEAFDKNEESVIFEVIYFGFNLEFRIPVANKEVFSQIIGTCHKIMELDVKTNYNFAVLCSKDPSSTDPKYELTRDRHLLPFDIRSCDECKKNKHDEDSLFLMWDEVVTNDPVKEGRKLNGDTILLDDATNIATNLQGLNHSTINVLARKLDISLDENTARLSSWRLPMAILVECEKKYPEAISKRHFARQLAEAANEIHLEKDKELLYNAVNLLDNEILKDLKVLTEDRKKSINEEIFDPFEV
ncbi:PREDICTED: uncharacterized protein LOC109590928 [Amphimedon queenslandica]|uniref:Uncharacterized protein n=1 Tax=Amphimedon queenslandica TaxID=400682 RepID=A0A1X7VPY9_AMPQE|nr:PREDICTED: uncharacterized protein LOC109590928 [Amphimedon queenslandica]|eukprot:XP_019862328.1 PREDICTED: uncharacterized protein LOC109590928 [Amphimedon queenslandica]